VDDEGVGVGVGAGAGGGAAGDDMSVDQAVANLMRRNTPKGHGPLARLYRGETRFDFVGRRRIWFTVSSIIILIGIASIVLRGGLNLGIEFKGGTEWTISAPHVTQAQAVDAVKGAGLLNPTVELLGSGSKQTLNVQSDLNRLPFDQQQKISIAVQKAMLKLTGNSTASVTSLSAASTTTTSTSASTTTTTAAPTTTTTVAGGKAAAATTTTTAASVPGTSVAKPAADKISITTVGPTWGSSVTNKAIEALIIFFIVVAIYISIRFEPKMALAAFIAMVHDILVAVGIYSIFNFQVTPDTVVAILTILGYSLYDTVVVFDRVRDNTKTIGSTGRMTYTQLINLSMNQTLARSINTSLVAILPVLAVLIVGAELLGATTLQDYGLALFVGLVSGAYSSIFIAAPVLAMLKRNEPRWLAIEKRLASRTDRVDSFSALDAANLSKEISMAAGGQTRPGGGGGGGGGGGAATKTVARRSGPIRPGSAGGRGSGGSGGSGGSSQGSTSNGAGTTSGTASPSTNGGSGAPRPKPRKGKGKRQS
jgi:preprotein translocase subunit SecF